MIVVHAFLDLLNIPVVLPKIFSLLKPGGLFYFTLNFDGATIPRPTIDPAFDVLVENSYHQTMDERITDGKTSGDSRTGRDLFRHFTRRPSSSDWVVFARKDGYRADIVDYIEMFYNSERLHSYLGYVSPKTFEKIWLLKKVS